MALSEATDYTCTLTSWYGAILLIFTYSNMTSPLDLSHLIPLIPKNALIAIRSQARNVKGSEKTCPEILTPGLGPCHAKRWPTTHGTEQSYLITYLTVQHPETAAQGRERPGRNGKASIWMMVAFYSNWNVTNLEQHRIETFVSLWPRHTAGIDTRGCIYHCRALRDRVSTVMMRRF